MKNNELTLEFLIHVPANKAKQKKNQKHEDTENESKPKKKTSIKEQK